MSKGSRATCDAEGGAVGVPAVETEPTQVSRAAVPLIVEKRDADVTVVMPHHALPAKDGFAFPVFAEVSEAFVLDGAELAHSVAGLDHLVLHQVIMDDLTGHHANPLVFVKPLLGLCGVDSGGTSALVVERLLHPFGCGSGVVRLTWIRLSGSSASFGKTSRATKVWIICVLPPAIAPFFLKSSYALVYYQAHRRLFRKRGCFATALDSKALSIPKAVANSHILKDLIFYIHYTPILSICQ